MTEIPTEQMTVHVDAPDELDDGIEITRTGRVRLRIDGTEILLRRPKIGEMRELEERMVAVAKRQIALSAKAAGAAADASTAAGKDADAATVQAAVEAVEQVDDSSDAIEAEVLDTWREVVKRLGGGATLPAEDDEMPSWLANWSTFRAVRKGWRQVPWLAAPPQ